MRFFQELDLWISFRDSEHREFQVIADSRLWQLSIRFLEQFIAPFVQKLPPTTKWIDKNPVTLLESLYNLLVINVSDCWRMSMEQFEKPARAPFAKVR